MKIAIDAMGGDHAPREIVQGALEAIEVKPDRQIILVGREAELREEVRRCGKPGLERNLTYVHAPEVIEMDEEPLYGLRKKKRASIAEAANLVKRGEAVAMVSAGNTGAVVTATKLKWRFLPGIARPAIATYLPTPWGVSVLLDAGANIDCKPEHLLGFGIMGDAFARLIQNKQNPKVGLLSIGTERGKGGSLVKQTFSLLENAGLNFIGNVEGRDIYGYKVDVIVTDGFVGNVVLKCTEGLAWAMMKMIKEEVQRNIWHKIGGMFLKGSFKRIARRGDYTEYGGAPLLGVNGNCIICHGSSNAKAIRNAIRVAESFVQYRVNDFITQRAKTGGESG
ncbi:MAG: phosphate acyltransferase PlsX [Candidatus Aureabacteria bacterium]|nr:phosphate acyltransferase PlsX [Candidatus Auribacterota bacterium]